MDLLYPALLLLAIPGGIAWWKTRSHERVTDTLRLAAGVVLLLALCGPYLSTSSSGRDLVIVVDRSRSMPQEAHDSALELIRLAEEERHAGDRVSVIAFGGRASVEHIPAEEGSFQGFEREIDRDASDLGEALEAALELIPEGREGAILLLSDGENNGRDAIAQARRAMGRRVRIDVRAFERPAVADLSVERLELPGEVAVGEPFQFNVWIRSDRQVEADFELRRGDLMLASGKRTFSPGLNRMVFRDMLQHAGVAQYEIKLGSDNDRVPENNRGLGAVQARGEAALLVLNNDGQEDTLVRALRQAHIPVAVATPEAAKLNAIALTAFRGVILENISANRIVTAMPALRHFVLERGGGLLLTGGRASFGVGGYYLSPLEELLPVTMEMRQEHRKMSIALGITLDRSGSMGMTVPGGQTKMDLANLGTAAAIELLSPSDAITVIAVDSRPHVIQERIQMADAEDLISKVRRIDSGGGGIFTYTALLAVAQQLEDAPQNNRHIILFADAADAEEHEGCDELVQHLKESMNTTLSVIALGSETDSDAVFLKRIAKLGGGEAYFTLDPTELPRLFAMDTLTAARSTFVEEVTGVTVLPDLFGMANLPTDSFPNLPGYNLAYMRAGAQAGMVTTDEYAAPIFSFMQQGLGRSAAYTGQIGGTYGAPLVAWDGFSTFFVTIARWLIGQEEPEEFFTSVRREGKDAILSVEVDPDHPISADTSRLMAKIMAANGEERELPLERVGEHRFEARYPLSEEGIAIGTVRLGKDRMITLPPIVLPYSPEFERSPDVGRGTRLLRQLARESGGSVGTLATGFFSGERKGQLWRIVSREMMIAGLLLLLIEIAGRRLSLWRSMTTPAFVAKAGAALATRRARRQEAKPAAARDKSRPTGRPAKPAAPATPDQAAPAAAQKATREKSDLGSALSRARRAADRKLGR